MKRTLLSLLIVTSITAHAQKGMELRINGGIAFFGDDPWISTGYLTVAGLYNFNGILAMGPTYSTGLGTKIAIDSGDGENSIDASLSEVGLLAQITFLRAGKFKMYATGSIVQVKGKAKAEIINPNFNNNEPITPDDSMVSFGVGMGGLLNLGGGLYFNILDFQVKGLKNDFMNFDQGFAGKAGVLSVFRTGISYSIQGK